MLSLENVSLSIENNSILKDINFHIEPGALMGIIGSSGAGKSSLFRLLTGEMRASSGTIKLDNIELKSLNLTSLQRYRRQIGIIFQDFRLLPKKSVFENIAFALEVSGETELIPKVVPELLELVGLSQRKNAFPEQLSGGEAQRVAIARALVHDPKIIIADEATGNLDPKNSREVTNLLKKINKERSITILFSTHDPLMIEVLKPRIIRLEKGTILFNKKTISTQKAFEGIL